MRFGVLKDIKNGEFRVVATPTEVNAIVSDGHEVYVAHDAGRARDGSVSYAAGIVDHFRSILNRGLEEACARDGYLRRSLTAYKGYLTHQETSGIQDRPWVPPEVILGIAGRKLDPAPQATVTVSENYYPEFADQI
jgi:alanine dehydrogenase